MTKEKWVKIRSAKEVEISDAKISDEWFTPIHILMLVQKFYEGQDFFDPASCAEAQKYVKATVWCDRDRNSLSQTWKDSVWLNPPYSQPLIGQFTEKLISSYQQGLVEALCLVNNCTETRWFQNLAQESDRRLDFRGRLKFWHPQKKADSPPCGQVLFYMGNRCDRFEEIFGNLGLIYSKPINVPTTVNSRQLTIWEV